MGYLAGTAVSDSGNSIRVTFDCHALAERTLNIISANISVDGGADYTAVQYASASGTLLTEGIELLPLCTSVGTAVIIENLTTKNVLFSGYVTQNTFTQQLITDTLTIECVDKLGYSMYNPVPDISFIQCNTLAGWCAGFGDILGVKNVYLSTAVTLRYRSNGKETPRYYRMTFPGDYFLKNTKPDVINGHATYAKQKMTIFEALTMIAESLRMTFVQVGNNLYLEEPSVTSNVRSYINALTYLDHHVVLPAIALTEESFGGTDNSVTTLPVYTLFSLIHTKSSGKDVIPPLFDSQYAKQAGKWHKDITEDEVIFEEWLTSYIFDVHQDPESTWGAEFIGWKSYKKDEAGDRIYRYANDWNKAIRVYRIGTDAYLHKVAEVTRALRCVNPVNGKGLTITSKITVTDKNNEYYPHDGREYETYRIYASLCVGGKYLTNNYLMYYNRDYYTSGVWVDKEEILELDIFPDGRVGVEAGLSSEGKYIFEFPYTQDLGVGRSDVSISIYSPQRPAVYYIEDLRVEEKVISGVEYSDNKPEIEELGTYEMSRGYGEVTLPIDLYYLSSEKTFGTSIDGIETAGAELRFGSSKMSMIEKIQTIATRGEGTQYDLTLRDDQNSVRLLQKYKASFFEGEKSVVAYEKNLLDNTTKITII